MRRPQVLICAVLVAGCQGSRADIFRTRPDGGGNADVAAPQPVPLGPWQIQLTGTVDASVDVDVFTLDIDTPASTLQALHAARRVVLCYFSAGTMEPFRDDAARFPAATLGAQLPAYPDERWVDIRNTTVRAIMRDRLATAADRGCDGIHPSGLGAFAADNGLGLSRDDQLAYDRWLATAAHERGLSIGLVEGDATVRQDLLADFDWTVVFDCIGTNCTAATPFTAAGKPGFVIEFGDATRAADVCPKAKTLGLSAVIKRDSNLDAFRGGCP